MKKQKAIIVPSNQKLQSMKIVTVSPGPQKPKKKKNKKKGTIPKGLALSSCSMKYLKALTDPFSVSEPCIPDFFALPSLKFSTHNRGSFTSSAVTGSGFIIVNPYAGIYNDGVPLAAGAPGASQYPPLIITTNNNYVGNSFNLQYGLGVLSSGLVQVNSNSPFSILQLSTGSLVKYRVVGCGIKIKYAGTELNLGGVITTSYGRGSNPIFFDAVNATSGDILRDPSAHYCVESTLRKEHYITFSPVQEEDVSYSTLANRMNDWVGSTYTTRQNVSGYSMFIGVSGFAASSPFTYEVVTHYEVVGPVLPSYATNFGISLTPSDIDPVGYGSVLSGISKSLLSGADYVVNNPGQFMKQTATFTMDAMRTMSGMHSIMGAASGFGSGFTQQGSGIPTITNID